MGYIANFTPCKLVAAQLLAADAEQAASDAGLETLFGPIDYASPVLDFSYTDYYRREMGERIVRRFVSFRDLVSPDRLAEIKIETNELEESFAAGGKRRINLDPGLLNLSRFVLATTKDNSHRIALRDGIYAELTLQYSRKDFQILPWTYPDYATREYRDILLIIRGIFKDDLKRAENSSGN